MKQIKLLGMFVALAFVAQIVSATLLLECNFNQTGVSVPSTGTDSAGLTMYNSSNTPTDLHGLGGSGVSGAVTDRAFDNTASTAMGSGTGGYASQADNNALDGMQSITLQGWYNTATALTDGARLISKQASAFDLGTGDFLHQNKLVLYINGTLVQSTNPDYNDLNTWVFFAATYDGATGTIDFYKGTTSSTVTLMETFSHASGTIADNAAGLTIGSYSSLQRPFDGLLDDIRIFGSTTDSSGVLNLAALEALRLNDLEPPAVPEPSTLWLLLGGGWLAWRRARRRR